MSTNADVLWFIGVVGLFNLIALTFIAFRLRAPVQVTVNNPPITVQAPHAVLPPDLMDTLQRVNEKLLPPTAPAQVELIDQYVFEGVAMAAKTFGLKGPDRFRIAREYVLERCKERNISTDPRNLAMAIEARVAGRNGTNS